MGWKVTPALLKLMNPEDQARYGPGIHPDYLDDHHPPVNTGELEGVAQRNFAVECKNRKWQVVWHGMHKRSTANRGCPDFIVAAYNQTFWIEFKRVGEDLSPDQKVFRYGLGQNGVRMYTVFSAYEAVQVIEQFACHVDPVVYPPAT